MIHSLRLRVERLASRAGGKTHAVREGSNALGGLTTALHGDVKVAGPSIRETTLQRMMDQLTAADGTPPKVTAAELWALGECLGRSLFGKHERPETNELWIETDDPFVAGLPWVLTRTSRTEPPVALALPVGVSVGMVRERAGLSPRPRMLIAAPDTAPSTNWRAHVAALRRALGGVGPDAPPAVAEIIDAVPTTAAALLRALKATRPEILYFYGHGVLADDNGRVDHDQLRLLMQRDEEEASAGTDAWPITKLADLVQADRAVRDRLGLVYLNCCWGGAAGRLGGPMQIGRLVPAFIGNRTSSLIAAAQVQGQRILELILRHGAAPHDAVALVACEVRGIEGQAASVRAPGDEPWWMTPTVFANYRSWAASASAPPRRDDELFTLRETVALDRTDHSLSVKTCLEENTQRPVIVFAWDGAEEDGLHALADRLYDDLLNEMLPRKAKVVRLARVPVAWPQETTRIGWESLALLINQRLRASVHAAGTNDSLTLAEAAERLLGAAGGIAMLEFDAVPAGTTPAEAEVLMRACAAALGDRLGVPLMNTTAAGRVQVVALVRFACPTGTSLLQSIPDALQPVSRTLHIEQLPPLDPVRHNEVYTFLGKLQTRRESLVVHRHGIARNIVLETQGRYERTRAALVECQRFVPKHG